MVQNEKSALMEKARIAMQNGWHCSESIVLAAGDQLFPDKLPGILRIAAPFSGGIGGTQEGLCGAFCGGLMVIGALHGRIAVDEDDAICLALSATFRERFKAHFGYLRCKDLRENWIGQPGQPDCAELTAQAVELLLDVIDR